MEKTTDFSQFDYYRSMDSLAKYPTIGEDQKLVLQKNAIRIVKVEDNEEPHPVSDLQEALAHLVNEAQKFAQRGILPNREKVALKQGLSLLGENLHNSAISDLAKQILLESELELVVVEKDESTNKR